MAWQWVEPSSGYRRRSRRRNRRNYARSYNNNYASSDDYDDRDNEILGVYDARGRRMGVVDISSPPDMLPPYGEPGDYARVRRRARF